MPISRILAVLAVIFFIVAFIVFAFVNGGNAKLVEDLTLLGLASLAGAHAF